MFHGFISSLVLIFREIVGRAASPGRHACGRLVMQPACQWADRRIFWKPKKSLERLLDLVYTTLGMRSLDERGRADVVRIFGMCRAPVRGWVGALGLGAALLALAGCGTTDAGSDDADAPIAAVCTTGMVADLVAHVGGEHVAVTSPDGEGVDPHLYKAVARGHPGAGAGRADLLLRPAPGGEDGGRVRADGPAQADGRRGRGDLRADGS